MSQHKTGYVISYHGILCHDMLYVTTITASLYGTIINLEMHASESFCVLQILKTFKALKLTKSGSNANLMSC